MIVVDEASALTRVESELARIADPRVLAALKKFIVSPRSCLLNWEYGHLDPEFAEPRYPGFMVFEHTPSNTGIAYSEYGSGPSKPWVLTFLENPRYGMDTSWFSSLEEAFRDSMAYENPEPPNKVKER